MTSNNVINVLCLHGFRHNASLLQKSMSELVKKLKKKNLVFDYVESPHVYISQDNSDTVEDIKTNNYRQWWSATKDSVTTLEKFDTYKESLESVTKQWNSKKYDIVLGFSQGSILAQLFCYSIENNTINTYKPKLCILASSFSITDTMLKDYYKNQLQCPVIHMYGTKDTFVLPETASKLEQYFANCITIKHTGGHYVSGTRDTYALVLDALKKFKIVS